MNLLCDTLRPVLLKYFQTKRTVEDANTFIQSSSTLDIDKDFLNLFSIMSVSDESEISETRARSSVNNESYLKGMSISDSNTFSKELKEIGRKLTIGILRYPKGCSGETYHQIDFDLEQVILEYKKQVNLLSKNILGKQIDNTCQTLEKRYWSRLLEDLDMEYYDDLLKILLGFRTNLLESLDGSGYKKETVMEYIDLEYIKQNLYTKSYRFIGLFQFIFDFVQSRLHPVLKETFTKLCGNFIESLEEDIESNKSIVLCLQFITNHVIEFLYLDVEESTRDITEP
jgi:hypothetical protein